MPTALQASLEAYEVFLRRYREARELGLSHLEARTFADSEVDIGELRKLAAGGCPARLASRILL